MKSIMWSGVAAIQTSVSQAIDPRIGRSVWVHEPPGPIVASASGITAHREFRRARQPERYEDLGRSLEWASTTNADP